ncbi:MAG: hypothetical protein ABIJ75_02150 [Actinomycetota bacterium]
MKRLISLSTTPAVATHDCGGGAADTAATSSAPATATPARL